ncbi:general substrate transporter, partial [Thozetella sp. PMI_491]
EEPLIANGRPNVADDEADEVDEVVDGDINRQPVKAFEHHSRGIFIWMLTLSAGISGLLFGYDTGVISATLVSIDSSLSNRPLTSLDKSIITSSTSLFALFVSPFSSVLADLLGRKRVILLADVLFILGALLQAGSPTVAAMVAGRSVVGAAVGAASFVVPLYIAELAPAAMRGRLVTMNVVFITLGQVVAYIVGWAFAEYGSRETGWRWMVGLGAVPAAIQAALLVFMPETPRWLVRAGQSQAAWAVIARVSGGGSRRTVDATLKSIEAEMRIEDDEATRFQGAGGAQGQHGLRRTWRELFGVRRNRRALAIATVLQGLQQLCGFNSLMYYSASIFMLVGFRIPTLTSLVVAVTNFIFTVAALLLIDRIGRRRVLLFSIPVMVVGLLLAAYGFSMIKLPTTTNGAAVAGVTRAPPPPSSDQGAAVTILISIMIFVAAYAIGLGNVPWMQSELFSSSVRSLGSGLATATNWGANFIIGLTFLPLMELLSPSWTFVLYATICVVGYAAIYRIYPEMAGLSLEEAARLLE